MTTHAILIPDAIAAANIDSFTRSCVSASNIDNGYLLKLSSYGAASGEAEVWTAIVPSTVNGLNNLWMAYDPELVWTSSYRGLDPDVRNYTIAVGRTFSCFKPQTGDLILMDTDCFTGAKGVNTFANATNAQVQFVWGATQSASCISLSYVATQDISFGTGAMDDQRQVAYLMEVIPQT